MERIGIFDNPIIQDNPGKLVIFQLLFWKKIPSVWKVKYILFLQEVVQFYLFCQCEVVHFERFWHKTFFHLNFVIPNLRFQELVCLLFIKNIQEFSLQVLISFSSHHISGGNVGSQLFGIDPYFNFFNISQEDVCFHLPILWGTISGWAQIWSITDVTTGHIGIIQQQYGTSAHSLSSFDLFVSFGIYFVATVQNRRFRYVSYAFHYSIDLFRDHFPYNGYSLVFRTHSTQPSHNTGLVVLFFSFSSSSISSIEALGVSFFLAFCLIFINQGFCYDFEIFRL